MTAEPFWSPLRKPLAFDLGCGLGGWTEGLQAEGYNCIGIDIEAHSYDGERYPGTLWVQDVRTVHGSQLKGADLIVASMPCTEYSYMAMPWRRSKQIAAALRGEGEFPGGYKGSRTIAQLNELFDTCFRIQREASAAAGRHVPMVVENVKGAQPWVGRAAWNFGSYYLWGDVPALMPGTLARRMKTPVSCSPRLFRDRIVSSDNPLAHAMHLPVRDVEGMKNPGFRFDGSGRSFQTASVEGTKVPSGIGRRTDVGKGARFTSREVGEGRKGAGAGAEWFDQNLCVKSSKSPARKAASARIAKIPLTLSTWIARTYYPREQAA